MDERMEERDWMEDSALEEENEDEDDGGASMAEGLMAATEEGVSM